jgi:hypothetical protein
MTAIASDSASERRISVRMLDATRRTAVRELWLGLERVLGGAPSLTSSWAWTEAWLEQFGDAVRHRFAVGEVAGAAADEGPVAIALVTEAPPQLPRPRAWHLGTAGEPAGASVFVERNRLLALPDARAAFAVALVRQLDGERGWDRLRLDGLHSDDAHDLGAALARANARVEATIEQCPFADLQEGDDVLAGLSGSRRQRVRRSLRAFGALELDWPDRAEDADVLLSELMDLHQRRWHEAGAPGAFSHPRYVAFHRAIVRRLVPLGRAAIVRVRRQGETVGCLYGLIDGPRLCFYQGGLQRYDDNRLRAGVAAHVMFMRACRERGLERYDFLAPATRYKLELASRSEPLTWIEASRPWAWRMRLSAATRSLRAKR